MIKFSIHPFFFVVFLFAFVHQFLFEVLLLFTIVLIHELGHAFTAKSFGWRVKKIQLLPFGGVAEVEEHGNRPWKEECLVILAGPLMNVLMIVMALIFARLHLWDVPFTYLFMEYNLIVLCFNLLPVIPLDGGRILQCLLSTFIPYKKAIRWSLWSSVCFLTASVLGMILFFPYYFTLWVVAVFLIVAQRLEWKQAQYQYMRFLMERYELSFNKAEREVEQEQEVVSMIVYPEQRLQHVLEKMLRNKWHYFCLVNQQGQIAHIFHERELLQKYFYEHQSSAYVADLLA